ncbi:MAG: ATP-grasp domain-containing protein [Deltaproteobacteria bacterium]|jgi:carbamoyl-phosphate synthase large subunit|nr:ATP-grasp domain-containing protein [Deltaproteobacteria bacterium]
MATYTVLGAERQSGVSLAAAYPEHKFVFVTDKAYCDGWDLPNVQIRLCERAEFADDESKPPIVLCQRWLEGVKGQTPFRLSSVLKQLEKEFAPHLLPTYPVIPTNADGRWLIKGDAWRKPDATLSGTPKEVRGQSDPYGCGYLFQQYTQVERKYLVTGRRDGTGKILLGAFFVTGEAMYREPFILACTAVAHPELMRLTTAMLDYLDLRGFFCASWLETSEGLLLSSLRREPAPLFDAFRKAGVDLLAPADAVAVLAKPVSCVMTENFAPCQNMRSESYKKPVKVLVLSAAASAINYIRSLGGGDGLELHVADCNEYSPGLFDGCVVPHVIPRVAEGEKYREAVDAILAKHAINVLIPTSDPDVRGLVQGIQSGWHPAAAHFSPPAAAHETLDNKALFAAFLQKEFLANCPKMLPDVTAITEKHLPAVIKPRREAGGKGVTVVHKLEDLDLAVQQAYAYDQDPPLLQEYIPGQTYIISLVYDREGVFRHSACMRSFVTSFTWGGGGCAGEIVDEPECLALSQKIIEKAGGWSGPINVEYRRHPQTGVFFPLEVNCRLNGYSYLATMNGIDLPRLVIELLTGGAFKVKKLFIRGIRERIVSGL